MDALLPPGASRSDDIAGPLEPMDWFTGTFKDPEVERRCGAAAFRLAFSVHVTLMSCFVVMGLVAGGIEFSHDGSKLETTLYLASMVVCFFVLSLAIRVRVHYMADEQKAQRFGARAWSVAWLFTTVSDAAIFLEQPRILCETYGPSSDSDPIFDVFFNAVSAFALVVVNSTHGMGFWEKTAVFSVQAADLGLCLLACVREPAAPGARASSAKLLMMTAASVVGFAFSHVLELQLRHHWREYQRMRTIVVVSQGREDEAATALHGIELMMQRMHLELLQRRERSGEADEYVGVRKQLREAGTRAREATEQRVAAQRSSKRTAGRVRWGGGGGLLGWTQLGSVEEGTHEEEDSRHANVGDSEPPARSGTSLAGPSR